MGDNWDDDTSTSNQKSTGSSFSFGQTTSSGSQLLGLGRGKVQAAVTDEPNGKWNPNRADSKTDDDNNTPKRVFGGFRNGGDNEGSGSSGSFGRGGGGGFRGGRGGRGGGNDSNSRACFNCGQEGHQSKDCTEPRKPREGGFGGRGGRGGESSSRGGFSGFGSRNRDNDENSGSSNNRACFNCNQEGHMSRDCPEPRKPRDSNFSHSRGGSTATRGGGFGSFRPENNGGGDTGEKKAFGGWGRKANENEDSNADQNDEPKRAFGSFHQNNNSEPKRPFGGFRNEGEEGSNMGAGFNTSRGGFGGRGGRGCFNCNQEGHQSRDCTQPRKPREGGSARVERGDNDRGFFGSTGRKEHGSDDILEGQTAKPQVERYIPPPAPTTREDIFGTATQKGENFQKYHTTRVKCSPEGKIVPIEMYEEAGLNTEVLANIRLASYDEPTAIQRYALPAICSRHDLMACAQTGSGKTAAFLLPIISNLLEFHKEELFESHHPPAPLCLVVSPTRELALQTEREARKFAFNTNVKACSVVGGHDMFTVSDRLRDGCHILSATTGRLKDMVEKGRISLRKVKYFVLDEADRMLDTGFEPDIRKLQELGLPAKEDRQTSMFSATFPDEVQHLAKAFLGDYIFLAVGHVGGANEDIVQTIELVRDSDKKDRLIALLEEKLGNERCLIFVETKRQADYIGILLSQKGLISTTMHGDRTQRQRTEAVEQFSNGRCPILVATSVAARGLDFPLIGYVVNYHLPDSSDFYVHRIGRTGRAGHIGKSISFFDPERESDRRIAPDLIHKLQEAGQEVPEFLQEQVSGGGGRFETSGFGHSSDTRVAGRSNNTAVAKTTATAGEADSWD
ncbi:unnamed protein product [Didymodactylos carnosus]|uniref:RNA helicase n=2 Tax=Didymodactylos carnosus TaxID=1234261 RepID=A0A813YZV9_9BILA|nr:unnamed protein product [Didymodactylos carnosus]CAF3675325.1 unnamed protein product [Didymodactylos carnosus]